MAHEGTTIDRARLSPRLAPQPSRNGHEARGGLRWLVMSYASEDLEVLAGTDEVDIETQAPGGPVHRTTIWVVVDDGEAFIRTYKGPDSRWYREAVANPAVGIYVGGRRLASTAIPASDPDSIERVSAGFRRKYPDDPATGAMVAPANLPTTLRLEPA